LREVKAIANRISVIRRGKVVGSAEPSASQEELASLMVGRSVNLHSDKTHHTVHDVALKVSGLTVSDPAGRALVSDVSFDLRGGEILAIAGVQGNGQSELAQAIINR
jgi:simple sugar transport system ATP-binding protein